ncbi:MAG TPA: hypothetical protein VJ890_26800 [Vineibacter sp.]|nr:hypothetical protein [Vineibacter sp.]
MSFLSELRNVQEPPQPLAHGTSPSGTPDATVDQGPVVADPLRTRHPYAKAFACAGVTYLVATGVVLAVVLYRLVPQATSPQLGDATAGVLLLFALPSIASALLTGFLVSRATHAWPVWRIALLFLPMFCAAIAVQMIGVVSD